MIVLDTNVVSELMRRPGDAIVTAWLDRQPVTSIWTTSITIMEVRFGIEILATGRRRLDLSERFERLIDLLGGRVLPFATSEAVTAAVVMARLRIVGRSSGANDAMIAGIVRTHRATLATRKRKHFEDAGVELVDPWAD